MSVSTPPEIEPEARELRKPEVARLFARTGDPLPEPLREETRRVAWKLFLEEAATGAAQLPLGIGDRVGPYRTVRLLGEGGQGWVYEAVHEQLEKRVAVKIPRPEVADRLLGEARLMVKLTHPRIVQVLDVVTEGPRPYMAMELCTGGSLDQRLELHPEGLPLEEVRRITESVLEALAFAHSRGVVHRDVKPANVLFDERDQPRLADLGTGAVAHLPDLMHSIDRSGGALPGIEGTPLYMAPEQERPALLAGGALDGRADLFSVGKLLFRLLTGSSPAMVRPPSRMRPELDPAWDELLFRLLEEDRQKRPPSAEAALAELRRLPGIKPAAPIKVEVRPVQAPPIQAVPARRRPAAAAFGALSLAALFFLALLEVKHPSIKTGLQFLPLKFGVALIGLSLRWFRRLELRLREPTPLPHALLLAGLVGGWAPLLHLGVAPGAIGPFGMSHPELALLGTALTTIVACAARLELFPGRKVLVLERSTGDRFLDALGALALGALAFSLVAASVVLAILMALGIGY